jgi:ABC-type transport system substrate-binding protein
MSPLHRRQGRPARIAGTNLLVNREAPLFDSPELRRVLALALDRKSFIDILAEGQGDVAGAMLPPPAGVWGMPPDILTTIPGHGPELPKNRAEARAIMERLGYGPDKSAIYHRRAHRKRKASKSTVRTFVPISCVVYSHDVTNIATAVGDSQGPLWVTGSKTLTEYMFSELSQITDIVASARNPRTA